MVAASAFLNYLQQQCYCCHASFLDCNDLTILLANYVSILSIIWFILAMSLLYSTCILEVRWHESEGIVWPEFPWMSCPHEEVALTRKQEMAVDWDLLTLDVSSNMVIDEVCCICLSDYRIPADVGGILQTYCCGNLYHRDCLALWLMQKRDDCPICRAKIGVANTLSSR